MEIKETIEPLPYAQREYYKKRGEVRSNADLGKICFTDDDTVWFCPASHETKLYAVKPSAEVSFRLAKGKDAIIFNTALEYDVEAGARDYTALITAAASREPDATAKDLEVPLAWKIGTELAPLAEQGAARTGMSVPESQQQEIAKAYVKVAARDKVLAVFGR